VTVQRGQSLSGIAQTYHVPMRIIAEANHLSPPYRIQAGSTLIIPEIGQPPVPLVVAALPPTGAQDATQATTGPEPPGAPVYRPIPAPAENSSIAAAPLSPPTALLPPPAGEPVAPAAKPAPPVQPAPPEPSASNAAPSGRGSGAFLWPVHGRVLATYGSGGDGTHNDGINIAAPRGAAVQAADAGVVAYAGNELRGYGNLILVKHANGWISAYAHCDLMLVKRGEKVARGQVIARVGSTGNVSEPQLHFELRRGNHPTDPREFLAPLPTAATKDSRSG
jgi:murein DD-endopeptidase MepM/ murein hydrolase activator NlpD